MQALSGVTFISCNNKIRYEIFCRKCGILPWKILVGEITLNSLFLGESIQVRVKIDAIPNPKVQWRKGNWLSIDDGGRHIVKSDPDTGNYSMTIKVGFRFAAFSGYVWIWDERKSVRTGFYAAFRLSLRTSVILLRPGFKRNLPLVLRSPSHRARYS